LKNFWDAYQYLLDAHSRKILAGIGQNKEPEEEEENYL